MDPKDIFLSGLETIIKKDNRYLNGVSSKNRINQGGGKKHGRRYYEEK
ncbi:hypothetical protein LEP1GSC051_3801 [Leptospira sp. P2653]|nr:hypothetical protein LEP1GSC051_3801 [Leptospira sp. P2653]